MDRAIELDPEFFPAYGNRVIAYSSTGEIQLAMANYGKAIELNPTYSLAYRNRGSAYLLGGELELAIADLDRTIELDQVIQPHTSAVGWSGQRPGT